MRDAFIQKLYTRAKSDPDIIFMSNEYGAPSLDKFRADLSKQFINGGISEQNLISVAAGMALAGKKVYVYSIASFITLRCYEQLKIDLCAMNLPVTLIGVGPCYAYGVDGPTHHATEDIAVMRALPNMHIYSPADTNMAAALVDVSLRAKTPVYCRLDRGKYPLLHKENENIDKGFSVLKKGWDICIIATGMMVHRALEIAKELVKYSIEAQVVELYRLKPIDTKSILQAVRNIKKAITIEEHTINGGLGSIVAEILTDAGVSVPLKRLAVSDDHLYTYGIREDIHCKLGLDKESIVNTIVEWN
jgi:transketolase